MFCRDILIIEKAGEQMTIGENIKQIRKEKGLTQKELGERLNMTQSAIGQFEKNKKPPKTETVLKIASALGVKASALMKGVIDWEQFTTNSSYVSEEMEHLEIIENYFKSLGFSMEYNVTKWHFENPDEPDPAERVQIPDEAVYILTKGGESAVFTPEEFEELQDRARETIEGIFYKKVVQKNK